MIDRLSGTIPALLTPFRDGDDRIDQGALDVHLGWLSNAGIKSVLVAGTTGEGQSLSVGERMELVAHVRHFYPDLALMAGTGFNSLTDTVEASQRALDLGVDALLIPPPCYGPSDPAEVFAFFAAVAGALPEDAPIVLYHIPQYTGAAIPIDVVDRLRDTFGERIVGLKDSGGEPRYHEDALRRLSGLTVFGSDGLATISYPNRAPVISALANIVPEDFISMERTFNAGRVPSTEIEARLRELRSLTHSVPQRTALKFLAHLFADVPFGRARAPELDLTQDQTDALRASPTVRRLLESST